MTITLDERLATRSASVATHRSQSPEDTARDLLGDALDDAQKVPVSHWVRPASPPAWVDEIKPLNPPTDGTNGMHRVFGAWPGDETNEEVEKTLQQIDDEDAGRGKHN